MSLLRVCENRYELNFRRRLWSGMDGLRHDLIGEELDDVAWRLLRVRLRVSLTFLRLEGVKRFFGEGLGVF